MHHILLSATLLLLLTIASDATTIGVTYNPAIANLPPPEAVVDALQSHRISAVRLLNPTPAAVEAFASTKISLLLSLPNSLIPSFAANRSAAALWLSAHILPFHTRTQISLISVGNDPLSTSATTIVPAIQNLRHSLFELGIKTIPVSTTFSLNSIVTTSFPPSQAEFLESGSSDVILDVIDFLLETESSILINVFPYNVYSSSHEVPIGFALFQNQQFNFIDDVVAGARYRNLFDMMVDSVVSALLNRFEENNIRIIVAETGWPTCGPDGKYAEKYLKELMAHLRSGSGTPLKKEGVAEAYIYLLFDDDAETSGQNWGIMHRDLSLKYSLDFSNSKEFRREMDLWKTIISCVCMVLLIVIPFLYGYL